MYKWMILQANIDIGLNLLDRGLGKDAVAHFDELIEEDTDNPDLYFWRGHIYRGLVPRGKCYDGQYRLLGPLTDDHREYLNLSIKDFEKALELHEKHEKAERARGKRLYGRK